MEYKRKFLLFFLDISYFHIFIIFFYSIKFVKSLFIYTFTKYTFYKHLLVLFSHSTYLNSQLSFFHMENANILHWDDEYVYNVCIHSIPS